MKARLKSVWKAALALMGAATGAGVSALADAAGHPIDPTLAVTIAGALATMAVLLGPSNKPLPTKPSEDPSGLPFPTLND